MRVWIASTIVILDRCFIGMQIGLYGLKKASLGKGTGDARLEPLRVRFFAVVATNIVSSKVKSRFNPCLYNLILSEPCLRSCNEV